MGTNDNKRGRREPTLGDLDHLDEPESRADKEAALAATSDVDVDVDGGRPGQPVPPRPSRMPPHRSPSRLRAWLWPSLAILIIVLAALAWFNQNKLRAMLPRTHLNTTLLEADQALAAGHLEGTNGTSAHELYAKVLREEPDNGHARRGLHKVGEVELARATSAINAGNYQRAAVSLANARQLLGGGTDVTRVADALKKAQHPTKRLHALIAQAQKAFAAGKLTGAGGAAALYRQVLSVNPQNTVASHGLDRAGDALATRVRDALAAGDMKKAKTLVGELGKWLPHEGALPALRAQLSQIQQRNAAIQSHLTAGQADLHQGRFTGTGDDNALSEFQAVLKLDPGNAQAVAGLHQVAQGLVLRANAALDAGDADQASGLLKQAVQLAPQSAAVASAQARLQRVAQAQPDVARTTSTAQPGPTPLQQVEINQLIRRAHRAAATGHIMLPPGGSAYDLYRQVLIIEPDNAAASAGLDALAAQVLKRFNKAMAAHQLDEAGSYLASMQSLQPDSLRATTLAQRLGNAWLDRAQVALDKGDDATATKALGKARELQPDPARMKVLNARLHND